MLVFRLQMNRDMWLKAAARYRLAQENAVKAGKYPGPTPFGYRPEHGKLKPHPVDGLKVTEAFRRAARDGIQAAAKYLGKSTSDTRKLLAKRVYLGEIVHATAGSNLHAHEPLTDLATWTGAQTKPRRQMPRNAKDYPLSGIVRCGRCEGPMTGATIRRASGKVYPRLVCSNADNGKNVCKEPVNGKVIKGNSISATKVTAAVRQALKAHLGDGSLSLSEEVDGLRSAEDDLRAAEAALGAYMGSDELLALGLEAFTAGAIKHRQPVDQAREQYQHKAAKARARKSLPSKDELDDDAKLALALGLLDISIVVKPGRKPLVERLGVRRNGDDITRMLLAGYLGEGA